MTQPMKPEPLSRAQFDPMRVEHYGLSYVPPHEAPHEIREAHDLIGVESGYTRNDRDGYGPWSTMAARHVVKPDDPVYTTQSRLREQPKGFKRTGISDPYSAPKMYQDKQGRNWMLDGHHRLAERRAEGKPLTVLRMGSDDLGEVRSWEEEAMADHNPWDDEGNAEKGVYG